ncbi:N-terminal Xaa-Pro-Lys N-methyltransferase 1-like [Dysidea avara]|uniref:N-terminal Xaa-Pro-Lys N-methyltransferase 1-like n=1 Tax=Dysidea avara TaxID=196820 RepID=UPI00333287FE
MATRSLGDGIDECLRFDTEQERHQWYSNAAKYWEAVPATINGMLGGFADLTTRDVTASLDFLRPFLSVVGGGGTVGTSYALDCGSGIGRVSKQLLLPIFSKVDLVEQNGSFLEQAPEYLGEYSVKVGQYYAEGLQTFTPEAGRYDVIWCQWVLAHLTDDDLVAFFNRCKTGLKLGGMIFVKENVTKNKSAADDVDHSVTRSLDAFYKIFSDTGLNIVKEKSQPNFPKALFPVIMFALA